MAPFLPVERVSLPTSTRAMSSTSFLSAPTLSKLTESAPVHTSISMLPTSGFALPEAEHTWWVRDSPVSVMSVGDGRCGLIRRLLTWYRDPPVGTFENNCGVEVVKEVEQPSDVVQTSQSCKRKRRGRCRHRRNRTCAPTVLFVAKKLRAGPGIIRRLLAWERQCHARAHARAAHRGVLRPARVGSTGLLCEKHLPICSAATMGKMAPKCCRVRFLINDWRADFVALGGELPFVVLKGSYQE